MRGVTGSQTPSSYMNSFQPALPMRGVTKGDGGMREHGGFQPALPMRGVTGAQMANSRRGSISTRTPHAGSDVVVGLASARVDDFNPHSPCGE